MYRLWWLGTHWWLVGWVRYLDSVGYGSDEASRFVRVADINGDEVVDFEEFHMHWGFLNAFQASTNRPPRDPPTHI